MQVKFKQIKFKNFLSYGNAETVIDLENYRHTIVKSLSGSGKSAAFLDSICYALYGKPYRVIKLGQLVNSINKKNLLVTIEFSVGSDEYKVVRGQKPNIFEIYKNGTLVLEDAASKDYQAYLDTNVLGINFKTFKQIIVIGSANYVPFMALTAGERRNITEEVLDIAIFSDMLDIAKQKVSSLKSEIDSYTYQISINKTQIESQKELIKTLSVESESKKEKNQEMIKEALYKIQGYEEKVSELDEKIEELSDSTEKMNSLSDARNKLQTRSTRLISKIETLSTSLGFYDKDECPTCGQGIEESFREDKKKTIQTEIDSFLSDRIKTDELLDSILEKFKHVQENYNILNSLILARKNLIYSIKTEYQLIESVKEDSPTESIDLCKSKLKSMVESLMGLIEDKNHVSIELEHYKASVDILKDNGIKSKIIAQFIPIMNKMINDYLQKFDLFVQFELDENFNETIKSRNRDTFSYNSFSEGEKKRINFGILFAWRQIAMMRNSVSTNIMIFDETLDSSLDDESIQNFTDILESIEESVNTIVISHRDLNPEVFDRRIMIDKVRDFSILKTV